MSCLLHIETSGEIASVCLSENEQAIGLLKNETQADHAAWLHPAIQQLLHESGKKPSGLDAISVTIGPGSYTGLRIGLAAAKGLCFALRVPLISVGTLEWMALSVQNEAADLICPVIDARRREVYTALYTNALEIVEPPQALILDETRFFAVLDTRRVLFCGSGCKKMQEITSHPHAAVSETTANASHLIAPALARFEKKEFSDTAYSEPAYIKDFYTPGRKK